MPSNRKQAQLLPNSKQVFSQFSSSFVRVVQLGVKMRGHQRGPRIRCCYRLPDQ
jgi:hypothetical protein